MYAIIKTGGKQYRVSEGDILRVELLEAEPKAKITFDQVLFVDNSGSLTVGQPTVKGATVSATVVDQTKGDKVIIFKKNRRHNYRRKRGHRQNLTVLKITNIKAA